MKHPKPIPIERHAKPESGCIAWSAVPKANIITNTIKADDKVRARHELEQAIRKDGYDPAECAFSWQMIDVNWGWTARLREHAL